MANRSGRRELAQRLAGRGPRLDSDHRAYAGAIVAQDSILSVGSLCFASFRFCIAYMYVCIHVCIYIMHMQQSSTMGV